ncbi:MAG: kelch repeat-containing protein [Desulfobacteraceae bacterium]
MKRLLLICIIVLLSAPAAWAGWELIAPMPHARFGHDATLGTDGNIYVMGGLVAKEKGDPPVQQKMQYGFYSNLVYDPGTGSWQYLEPVPGRYGGSYRYLQPDTEKETWKNGWIQLHYLHSENNDCFEIVNPESRKGEIVRISIDKLRNTNFRRQGDGVEIVAMPDNRIWWIGGRQGAGIGRGERLVLAYDPQTDTWPHYIPKSDKRTQKSGFQTDIPEMNERRMAHEAVRTPDGKIFVFGGWRNEKEEKEIKGRKVDEPYYAYTKQVATDTVECYDPKTNQWTYRTSMSSKRLEHAAVLGPDGKIYVFGGAKSPSDALANDYLDTTEVYDPQTDTWSE